jgi:tetrahydromethanopterin S-methyltransferase subunit G
MSRVRQLFMIVLPSMLVGGLVFGPALSQAHDGRDSIVAFADDGGASDNADVPRRAERPRTAQGPTPPTPPKPPKPPRAPAPPHPHGGVNVSINGNRIDVSGIEGMVRGQLDGVREMIRNNPNIPPPLRAKILARIDKVRGTVDKRLSKLKGKSLEQMGEELEQMGEEIEQAMEGLEEELEQLGDQVGKDLGKNIQKNLKNKNFKFKFDHDPDPDDDEDVADAIPMTPDLDDVDDGDMREALDDMKGMAIKPQQKEQIARIRAEADKTVTVARSRLDELSKKLEGALANPRTPTGDIERYVDQISAQEAAIRKARIVSWVKARAVLDDGQRKRIEAAAAKRHQ